MARMDRSYRPAAAFESACEILCKMGGEIGAGHLENPGMAISIAAKVDISTHWLVFSHTYGTSSPYPTTLPPISLPSPFSSLLSTI